MFFLKVVFLNSTAVASGQRWLFENDELIVLKKINIKYLLIKNSFLIGFTLSSIKKKIR